MVRLSDQFFGHTGSGNVRVVSPSHPDKSSRHVTAPLGASSHYAPRTNTGSDCNHDFSGASLPHFHGCLEAFEPEAKPCRRVTPRILLDLGFTPAGPLGSRKEAAFQFGLRAVAHPRLHIAEGLDQMGLLPGIRLTLEAVQSIENRLEHGLQRQLIFSRISGLGDDPVRLLNGIVTLGTHADEDSTTHDERSAP